METEKNQINKKSLRYRFTAGTIGVLLTLGAVVVSTYAWYVYNTGRHTTKVRMAAGAGINLQISNAYDGVYGSAAVLDSFSGQLNPVIDEPDQRRFSESARLHKRNGKPVQSGGESVWKRRLQRLL